jgi:protoporphyrinogen/coproporphyrinogen III oxidase
MLMNVPEKASIVIVGAGLTGLSLAFYLKKKGVHAFVVEKEKHIGGVIRSYNENGFVYEQGPNTGVLANMETSRLFEGLHPDCILEVANPEAKRRLIWKDGSWHALPSGLVSAITTPLFSLRDKFRILAEPLRGRGKDDMETVADLVRRRMGKSFLDYAVDPFIGGIYAGDPERLVTKYALPKLYRLEQIYGSFIGGAIRKKWQDPLPQPSREVFSVRGGLENLIHALAKRIGRDHILTDMSDLAVHRQANAYRLKMRDAGGREHSIQTPVVITTVGGYRLKHLLPFISEAALKPLVDLHYARVIQVVLGFRNWEGMPLHAFGGLVPSREGRQILGVLFPSAFLSGRAPESGSLLNVFLGGVHKPHMYDMSDQQLMSEVEREVSEMLQIRRFTPDLVRIFRYQHAIPQYMADSPKRLKAIADIEQQSPGLLLAGNIQEGIGIADRVAQAARIADMLAE